MPKRSKLHRKENFSVITKYGAFYTGGNVQFTKDGHSMLCSCGEVVKIVNVEDGKVTSNIGSQEEDVELSSFLLANDDVTLITAEKNGILKHWNFKDGNLMRTWKSLHVGRVAVMAFDSTTTLLATGGSDSTIKVWDVLKKYCTHNLKGAQGVFSVLKFYNLHGKLCIFGAADDCKIHVWDLDSSKRIAFLDGHFSAVTGMLFLDDRNQMISCGRDKVLILWDLENCSNRCEPKKVIPVFEAVESVFLSPKNLLSKLAVSDEDLVVVTAGNKGVLKIWNAYSGKCLLEQKNSLVAPPEDAEYDGQVITHAEYVASIDVICVVSFEHNIVFYRSTDFEIKKQFVGFNDDILDVKFMGKDDSHLAVATNSPHIKVFELSTFNCQLLKGHLDLVVALDVFRRDPYLLVSASKDNFLRVWKMDDKTHEVECRFVCQGHTHSVGSVACSRTKLLCFLSGSQDNTLKLWDIPEKVPLVALMLSVSSRCAVKAHDKTINSIEISCNDKLAATGSQDSTAKVWNLSDLSLVGVMRGHRKGIWCVKFSPIDLVLATSSADGTIKVWSLTDFTTLKTFEGHESSVLNVHFLSKGTQMISSASDGLLKLWDIKNNDCTKTFDGHSNRVWALTVSSDESFVVTGGADSNIMVWKDITEEEKEKAQALQEEFILREQDLSNFIKQKKWTKALQLAVLLEQPFRALNIINEILMESKGREVLNDTIKKMQKHEIDVLLKFAVEWNTNSKNYLPAQLVLKAVLQMNTTEELLQMPDRRATIEALLPYTERHYQRISRMLQDAHIVSFLWQNMKIATEATE